MPSSYAVDTDIANLALGHLGKPSITSIDGNSVEAKKCKFHLPIARRTALMASNWTFARSTIRLARLSVDNPYSDVWTYLYDRPNHGVKLWGVLEPTRPDVVIEDFRLERGRIYCNVPDALLQYIDDVIFPAEWSDPFADAVALNMAMRMAPSFTRRRSDIAALQQQYFNALTMAIEYDALQETERYARDHTYMDARDASPSGGERRQADGSTIWRS